MLSYLKFFAVGMTLSGFMSSSFSDVVATVNQEKINRTTLETALRQELLYPSHRKISEDTVLQDLINHRLAVQEAKKKQLDLEPRIQEKIDEILHQALISSALESKLAEIKVKDSEVEDYYKKFPEYKTSHILLRLRAVPSKEEVQEALKRIYEVHRKLKDKSITFEAAVKEYSQVANTEEGGDIGFLPKTSMSPEYYEAIKGKKAGFLSEPVRTQFGYHIIKVTGVKPIKKIDQNLYKKILFEQKRDKVIDEFYASLRKNAKISISLAAKKAVQNNKKETASQ